MENIFDSAKTIQEKRKRLKGLSKPLQILVKEAAIPTVNDGLKAIYAQSGHTELKTLKQWNKEGRSIKKGSHALCLWGAPKKVETIQVEEAQGEDNDPMNFYPICFVFSNLQVYEISIPTKVNALSFWAADKRSLPLPHAGSNTLRSPCLG